MLYSYSFRARKNGETFIKTDYTSFSAIAFMMDCLECECPGECDSDRFLRELKENGEAETTEIHGGDLYTSVAWRNEP